ncbi:collagen alpha-1(III) chain-like isoform X1 [Myotis myotis]|uniref:collagen alpha-1(III) chain-like isoform X1 n=1 Tax=Myotis myotis TaxID=51298 RepID=UPI00174E07F7|nr:collagen alpha-1(III) chain-like isoform X1 [Myotis myotis]
MRCEKHLTALLTCIRPCIHSARKHGAALCARHQPLLPRGRGCGETAMTDVAAESTLQADKGSDGGTTWGSREEGFRRTRGRQLLRVMAQPRAAIKLAQPGPEHAQLGPSWSLLRGHIRSAAPSKWHHEGPVAVLGTVGAGPGPPRGGRDRGADPGQPAAAAAAPRGARTGPERRRAAGHPCPRAGPVRGPAAAQPRCPIAREEVQPELPRGGRQVPGVRRLHAPAGAQHGAAAAPQQRAGAGRAAPLPGAGPRGRAAQARAAVPSQRPGPGHHRVAARPRRWLQPHLPHRLQGPWDGAQDEPQLELHTLDLRDFGAQGNCDPEAPVTEGTRCCRQEMYIDLQGMKWAEHWVLEPPGFLAYECVGTCQQPPQALTFKWPFLGPRQCIASETTSLPMIVGIKEGGRLRAQVVSLPNMRVQKCSCASDGSPVPRRLEP